MATGSFRVHSVKFYQPTTEAIHCMTFSEDEQKLALSRSGGQIEIWNFSSPSMYQEKIIPPQVGQSIESLVWCQRRLFSVGLDGFIVEYDLVNLKAKSSTPTSFGACWCMSANDANTHLAVGTEDGYIILFQLVEETINFCRCFDKQEGRIMCISWHESGDFIATGSLNSVRFWDTKTGTTLQHITMQSNSKKKKDQIVWCIKLTSEFEIICGLSSGCVMFIDAHQGVIDSTIKSHSADILCLAFNKNDSLFYASGIDPTIIAFTHVKGEYDIEWGKSYPLHYHTHDVRTMVRAGTHLISGGVDREVIVSLFEYGKLLHRLPPYVQHSCVHVAGEVNFILLQNSTGLDVCELGRTTENSKQTRTVLGQSSEMQKLIQITAKENEFITCSSISNDGKWLSYATNNSLRVFQVELVVDDYGNLLNISLLRVRFLPKECGLSLCQEFSPDASRLYSMLACGDVQVLGLDPMQLSFIHEIKSDEPLQGCHLLCVSLTGDYIAVASHSGVVFVYNTATFKLHCKLPKMDFQPTAMTFLPEDTDIIVAYESGKVVAFDLKSKAYSNCFTIFEESDPDIIRGIAHCPSHPNVVLLQTLWRIHLLNLKTGSVKKSHQYRHLLEFKHVKDNFMVALEVPYDSQFEKLPPALLTKKFR